MNSLYVTEHYIFNENLYVCVENIYKKPTHNASLNHRLHPRNEATVWAYLLVNVFKRMKRTNS